MIVVVVVEATVVVVEDGTLMRGAVVVVALDGTEPEVAGSRPASEQAAISTATTASAPTLMPRR